MNLNNKTHPIYESNKWNNNKYICKSHNCYAYALNLIYPKYANICKQYLKKTNKYNCPRPQPGIYSGYVNEYKLHSLTCSEIINRMQSDNPLITKLKLNQECPNGYYKIALFVLINKMDYHFYRQDKNGLWSHKDGWRKVTNKDFLGRIIRNPEIANKKYPYIFCGYFCIPNDPNKKYMSNYIHK